MSARPLRGERIVITRAAGQAAGWSRAFNAAGAEVEHLPLIEIVPPRDLAALAEAARKIDTFDWLVLTSANAVEAFMPLIGRPVPPGLRIAVVGPATARTLAGLGLEADLEAARPQAEGLVEELARRVCGQRVLFPRADDARATLTDGLRAAGAEVEDVVAYAKHRPAGCGERLKALSNEPRPWWITLSSPRIARTFVELVPGAVAQTLSIGPVTSEALRALGVEPTAEAARPTAEAMIDAIVEARSSIRGSHAGRAGVPDPGPGRPRRER